MDGDDGDDAAPSNSQQILDRYEETDGERREIILCDVMRLLVVPGSVEVTAVEVTTTARGDRRAK